jgi:hypothetical protein
MFLFDVNDLYHNIRILQERANEERGGEETPAVLAGEWPSL